MIIPREELKKFNKLNELLQEYYSLKEKIQFRTIYAAKIQNLLQNSTRKSVGCEAKFRLNPEVNDDGSPNNYHSCWGGDGTHWVLTREGIKEEFGYTGDFKCRKPSSSIWWDAYVNNKVATTALIKCIGHKDVRCESALKEHIQIRKDLHKLKIEDGTFFNKIELKLPIKVQRSVEAKYSDDYCEEEVEVIGFSTSTLVFMLGGGWRDSTIAMVDGEVKWRETGAYQSAGWEYNSHDTLENKASFVQFLRYSEPEVYDVLVKTIQEQIDGVKAYITKQTAEVEAVMTKYGHYLVFSEL